MYSVCLYECVLDYVCALHTCLVPVEIKEGTEFPAAGGTDGCESPCGASVRTVSAQTAGPFLQPLITMPKSQHRSQHVRDTTGEREAGGLCGLRTWGAGGLRKSWQTPRSFAGSSIARRYPTSALFQKMSFVIETYLHCIFCCLSMSLLTTPLSLFYPYSGPHPVPPPPQSHKSHSFGLTFQHNGGQGL